MPTAADVITAIRTRIEAALPTTALQWPNEANELPDSPVSFVYTEILFDRPAIVAFGGGRGGNQQRTTGRIEAHVMVPSRQQGVSAGVALAETICATFRGLRLDGIRFSAGQVMPMEGATEDGAYAHVADAWNEFEFDQTA